MYDLKYIIPKIFEADAGLLVHQMCKIWLIIVILRMRMLVMIKPQADDDDNGHHMHSLWALHLQNDGNAYYCFVEGLKILSLSF